MVCMLSKGFKVNFGVAPAAKATTIVSPRALEMARIKEAAIPERAAGTTTCVATSNLLAPSPYAASLRDWGTAIIASSLKETIKGMIITPMARLALKALKTLALGKISRLIGGTKGRGK